MSIPPRLSVVTIGALNLPGLRTFYGALGWEELDGSDDDWAAYLVGGVLFAIYPLDELAQEAGAPDRPMTWSGTSFACNMDSPEDVDRAFDAALKAGATPISTPVSREWGGRSGYIADPEGNRWEIVWAPTARFDDRGSLIGFGT